MIGILIVLDGLGIGAMDDAQAYGDSLDVNTLKNVLSQGKVSDFPTLEKLGLFNLLSNFPTNSYESVSMKLNEASSGKDTITGHWEMMGVITKKPFPTLENGFPKKLIDFIEKTINRKIIGLKNISGTTIIEQYGHLHSETHFPIVYTSTDSVIQIAANEAIVPLSMLYSWCEKIHDNLPEEYKVARVIARPFIETDAGFVRTPNRKDFSVIMPKPNTLSNLEEKKIPLYAFGKIADIYKGVNFVEHEKILDNSHGMKRLILRYISQKEGLLILNLNDFDSKYGHRRDVVGYYNALKIFDKELAHLITILEDEDFLLLTGDHGCDPTAKGTNHTREKVPYILYSKKLLAEYGYKNERSSFAIVGETIEKLMCKNISVRI